MPEQARAIRSRRAARRTRSEPGARWVARVLVSACLAAAGCESPGPAGAAPGPDDEYAIRCVTLDEYDHVPLADRVAETLRRVEGLRPELVRVLHAERESTVYYGRYSRVQRGAREAFEPDPRGDLELIRRLSLPARRGRDGQAYEWPFLRATVESLPRPQSVHPQWDLERQTDGYWSWHVGVFYNEGEMRQRRAAAEEYCRILREQGEEAYFHHGAARSSVCIGLFPKEAIQNVEHVNPFTGEKSAVNRIVDPRMLALQQKYPMNLENGRPMHEIVRDPATGAVKERVPVPTFPVLTPLAERRRATP